MISRSDVVYQYAKFAEAWGDKGSVTEAMVDLLCDDLKVSETHGTQYYELSDLRQAFNWLLRKKQGRQGFPSLNRVVAAVEQQRQWRIEQEKNAKSPPRSGKGLSTDWAGAVLPTPASFQLRVASRVLRIKWGDRSESWQHRMENDEDFVRPIVQKAITELEDHGVFRDGVVSKAPNPTGSGLDLIWRLVYEEVHFPTMTIPETSQTSDPFAGEG